jgi:hypothetical protein
MTREHEWFERHVALLCTRMLEVDAIIEHPISRSDVYIPKFRLRVEIQRVGTDFLGRTQKYFAAGSRTVWLITESNRSSLGREALSRQPGVQVRVRDPRSEREPTCVPWSGENAARDPLAFAVIVTVNEPFGPCRDVEHPTNGGPGSRDMSLSDLLERLFSDEIAWYQPGFADLGHGAWLTPGQAEMLERENKPLSERRGPWLARARPWVGDHAPIERLAVRVPRTWPERQVNRLRWFGRQTGTAARMLIHSVGRLLSAVRASLQPDTIARAYRTTNATVENPGGRAPRD